MTTPSLPPPDAAATYSPAVTEEDSPPSTPLIQPSIEPPSVARQLSLKAWLGLGWRAAVFQPLEIEPPAQPTAVQLLTLLVLYYLIYVLAGRLLVPGAAQFYPQAVLLSVAELGVFTLLTWLLFEVFWPNRSAAEGRWGSAAEATLTYTMIFTAAAITMSLVFDIFILMERNNVVPRNGTVSTVLYGLGLAWAAAVTYRICRALLGQAGVAIGLAVLGGLMSYGYASYFPYQPWYAAPGEQANEVMPLSQEIFEQQQSLLQTQLQALAPSPKGQRALYAITYAPYAGENVFRKESAMVTDVLESQFQAKGRTIELVNNFATTSSLPWASPLNLQRSVESVAGKMDLEKDVLLLYLTSHGGANFELAAAHWPLTIANLTAPQLRQMLDAQGIQNAVIVVSACYSGGWVEPLKSERSMVMTAADDKTTSYGCGRLSELTFFGRAVFDEQLRKTRSFVQAFHAAVPIIEQREIEAGKDDGFSNPQLHVGKQMEPVLRELAEQTAPANGSK